MNIVSISAAVTLLNKGAILAYPTESIYGIGCIPTDIVAVLKLRQLKDRSDGRGVIVIASHFNQVQAWLSLESNERMQAIFKTWPGHHTWVFQASHQAPSSCVADDNTIAVRISAHPVVIALCDKLQHPLVSTSANPLGLPPAKTAAEVTHYFDDKIQGIVAGELGSETKPSQIHDARTLAILR